LIVAPFEHFGGELRNELERALHAARLFEQHDLLTATENLYLIGGDAKFLWKPNGLTVSGPKNPSLCH